MTHTLVSQNSNTRIAILDITIVNSYVPRVRGPNYIKKILRHLKGHVENNTRIVVGLIILTSLMER